MTDNVQAYLLLETDGGGLWQESWYIFHSLKDAYYTDFFFFLTRFKINGLLNTKTKQE